MPFTPQFSDRRQHLPTKHRENGCQSGLGRAHRAPTAPTSSRISSRASWTLKHRSSSQVTSPPSPKTPSHPSRHRLHFSFILWCCLSINSTEFFSNVTIDRLLHCHLPRCGSHTLSQTFSTTSNKRKELVFSFRMHCLIAPSLPEAHQHPQHTPTPASRGVCLPRSAGAAVNCA